MDVGNFVLTATGKKSLNTLGWVALTRERERERNYISAEYFSWKFLCKQVLN